MSMNKIIMIGLSSASLLSADLLRLSDLSHEALKWGGLNRGLSQPQFTDEGKTVTLSNSSRGFLLTSGDVEVLPENLVISFEVKINGSADAVGIGLDSDLICSNHEQAKFTISNNASFGIFNEELTNDPERVYYWGETDDGFARYSVVLGGLASSYKYLTLIADDRNSKDSSVVFRQIKIYNNEGSPEFSTVIVNEDLKVLGDVYIEGSVKVKPQGDIPTYGE